MQLHSPQSAVLSAVIFNALVIVALIPLALRGVKFRAAARRPSCAATSSSTASAGSSCRSSSSSSSTSSSPRQGPSDVHPTLAKPSSSRWSPSSCPSLPLCRYRGRPGVLQASGRRVDDRQRLHFGRPELDQPPPPIQAAAGGDNPLATGGSNLGPRSKVLVKTSGADRLARATASRRPLTWSPPRAAALTPTSARRTPRPDHRGRQGPGSPPPSVTAPRRRRSQGRSSASWARPTSTCCSSTRHWRGCE